MRGHVWKHQKEFKLAIHKVGPLNSIQYSMTPDLDVSVRRNMRCTEGSCQLADTFKSAYKKARYVRRNYISEN